MKKKKAMSQFSFVWMEALIKFLNFFSVRYHHKGKYIIKKDEPIIVISNHQTDIDPVLVNLSFSRLLQPLATDNLFKKGFTHFWLTKFGAIPKKKGSIDIKSTILIMKAIKEKNSVIIFPEGNRTYAEFQYKMTDALPRLLKGLKTTVVLFNLHGGNGTRPRFAHRPRRGRFYGEIKKVLTYDEYKDMTNDELLQLIKDNIRVYDSESGQLFKSKKRAEYLERMLFVCPECQSSQTLYSKKELVICKKCGFKAEFTEDLRIKPLDSQIKFTKLLDWYNYQKMWVKQFDNAENDQIFIDENVTLFTCEVDEKRHKIARGKMVLTNDTLTIGKLSYDLANLEVASPVSGFKLCFTHKGKSYQITGHKKFNPLKYVLMFNKLDTALHRKNVDQYFTLTEEIS